MKLFAALTTILALAHLVLGDITTVQIEEIATRGNEHNTFPEMGSLNAAGGRYIFVHSFSPFNRVIIFERDSPGTYATLHQTTWPRTPVYITTNGNWFGTLGSGFINTFQLTANGTFVNMTEFTSTATFMQFLGDNTLVLFKNSFIETYEFIASSWTKIHEQSVNFTVMSYFSLTNGGSDSDSVPHVTDTTIAAFNPNTSSVEMYTRNQDKSWSKVDEISLTSEYRANRIIWNGDDTVVLAHTTFKENSTSFGRLLIYKQNSGAWSLTRVILNSEVSSAMPSYLGFSMLLFDRNTIAVGAPGTLGDVFVLQRLRGSDWAITTRFIGFTTYRRYFGFNVMRSDYEMIVQTWDTRATSKLVFQVVIPDCYMPIQLQCLGDVTYDSDTCQNGYGLSYPYSQFYNLKDRCTNVRMDDIQISPAGSSLSLSFSRDFSDTFYCNVTIHCASPPVAPVAPPQAVVSPVNVPQNSPMIVGSPPATTTPVSSPVFSPITPPSSAPEVVSPLNSPVIAPSISPITSPVRSPTSNNAPVTVDPGEQVSGTTWRTLDVTAVLVCAHFALIL
jgi:hypothetical protein